jgi:hypothetical protein
MMIIRGHGAVSTKMVLGGRRGLEKEKYAGARQSGLLARIDRTEPHAYNAYA